MHLKQYINRSLLASLFCSACSVWAAPTNDVEDKSLAQRDTAKYVFAHFMVGIVENYTVADWKGDMAYAQEIGIDAFALNCASIDSYTPTQLANAYEAAAEVGFHVFISFDFAYWNNGDTAKIAAYMQQYAGHPAQMQYDGGAVVSTFVGDSFNWQPVKDATPHKIFAIPMLQDPIEATYEKTAFDGAFSWLAWPTDGGNSIIPGPMTTIWDDRFVLDLAGKPYMAPVSPWFSTHFNSKNWVFICEELITDRWNEMLALQPQLIEIITWNDYGESHYIGPAEPHHKDDGSAQWAAGFPHDGWRIISKPYIAAYKAGASAPTVTSDQLVYWYRPTPKNVQCTGDPLGPPSGLALLADDIFVTTLLTSPATLTVTSGGNTFSTTVPAGILTNNFTMGLGAQTFSVTRNGATILSGRGGLDIVNTCVFYNFNAYVGSINGTGGSVPPPSTTTTKPVTIKTTTTTTSSPPPPTSTSKVSSTTTTPPIQPTTTTTSIKPSTTVSGGCGRTITASSQIFPTNCIQKGDVWAGPPNQDKPATCDGPPHCS